MKAERSAQIAETTVGRIAILCWIAGTSKPDLIKMETCRRLVKCELLMLQCLLGASIAVGSG